MLVVNVGPGKSHFRWLEEYTVLKFIVLAGASLAFVSVAAAADLPRPQPVYSQAPVGKQPIGKTPVGKTPIGKTPIGKNPTLVTKG